MPFIVQILESDGKVLRGWLTPEGERITVKLAEAQRFDSREEAQTAASDAAANGDGLIRTRVARLYTLGEPERLVSSVYSTPKKRR